jgi:hypothetical protein
MFLVIYIYILLNFEALILKLYFNKLFVLIALLDVLLYPFVWQPLPPLAAVR